MQPNQWFVVLTNPQREEFVGTQLDELQPYLPRFKTVKGRIAPLFPGYLFVPAVEHWSPICTTVGVRSLLMSGDHPARVPHTIIAAWKGKERGGLVQLPPPPRFRPGERLTIIRGSLKHRTVIHAGMVGRDRERVLIEMLGQLVPLTVASNDLVPEYHLPQRKNFLHRRREPLTRQGQVRSH